MSLIANGAGESAASSFYDFEIENSLLFNGGGGLRINSGEANTAYYTLSCWIKRHKLGGNYCTILSACNYTNPYYTDVIGFGSANTMLSLRGSNANAFTSNAGTAVVRDTSAWYHYCLRNNNGSVTRWLNGVQDSTYSISGTFIGMGRSGNHDIGAYGGTSESYNNNFSLAEFYFINDSGFNNTNNYDYSQFAEFKNGVLVPKENSLTAAEIGDGGWYYEFKQTGNNADANGVGADSSGNAHHASIIGTVSAHCRGRTDTPTNNFCIINSNAKTIYGANQVQALSEGNLKVAKPSADDAHTIATMSLTPILLNGDGVYFEARIDGGTSNNSYIGIIAGHDDNAASSAHIASYDFKYIFSVDYLRGYIYANEGSTSSADYTSVITYSAGDIIGFSIKSDGKVFVHKNGTYFNNLNGSAQNPATGANPLYTLDRTKDWLPYTGGESAVTFNFGQDSSFAGTETATSNSDANGNGTFHTAPPSGFLALCTANLPEPTIGPNSGDDENSGDYFNTVIYTGSGSSGNAITGVGFKPDWVWIKKRAASVSHALFDSSRGVTSASATNKALGTDRVDAEGNGNGGLSVFGSDGFTLVDGTSGSYPRSLVNDNVTYVAWNWKANGGTTTTNDASSTSVGHIDSVFQANTTAGFSIVTWTGNGNDSNNTIAHGLGVTPAMHITKSRTANSDGHWIVWHEDLTDNRNLFLNLTNGENAEGFGSSTPTNNSTVFETAVTNYTNVNGHAYISYVFAEVEGYSKFGSYTGNSNADGAFVYLGFRPAWVLIKNTDTADDNWYLADDVRDANGNPMTQILNPNRTAAEYTTGSNKIDFQSNGFKARDSASGDTNISGELYIYMAFARAPFKYANAK